MVRRVDIKYKNEFQHKGCFITCFNSYNSNCIDIGMNFGTKLVFRYLFCRLEIQIIVHPIFPELTVKNSNYCRTHTVTMCGYSCKLQSIT